MRILYKFPSRGRPDKFFAHLDNILSFAQHDDFLIVPTLDSNDYAMLNEQVISKLFAYYERGNVAAPAWGRSTSKVHACNRDLEKTLYPWDIVVLTSDDMEFIEPGFDLKIIKAFEEYFPDTDGVLHYGDGFAHGEIVSIPIMGRKYYERKGYIYFPGYQSFHCDEELLYVARKEEKCVSLTDQIVRHNHPMNKQGLPLDALYKYNDKFYPIDKGLFQRRKARNFGL